MNEQAHRHLKTLLRQFSDIAKAAHFDGLDPRTAILAAAINTSFPETMTRRDIAQWLRRFANELEA